MKIRENEKTYLVQLKNWLEETKDVPLEEMGAFFSVRLDSYETHMAAWAKAYEALAEHVPPKAHILDLGCGTGLEAEAIFRLHPESTLTGVDLSKEMLGVFRQKFPTVKTIQANYFRMDFKQETFDTILSFETLHHFTKAKKLGLFRRCYDALPLGGLYLEVDYLACCQEEETLLQEESRRRRLRDGISPGAFVHFDTPLTPEHELELLHRAGFTDATLLWCIDGACLIEAHK